MSSGAGAGAGSGEKILGAAPKQASSETQATSRGTLGAKINLGSHEPNKKFPLRS